MHQFTRDPSLPSYPRKRLDAGHRLPGGADVTDPVTGLPIRQVNIIYIRISDLDPDPPEVRINMFLGLPDLDPDPFVRGMDPDPDPSII